MQSTHRLRRRCDSALDVVRHVIESLDVGIVEVNATDLPRRTVDSLWHRRAVVPARRWREKIEHDRVRVRDVLHLRFEGTPCSRSVVLVGVRNFRKMTSPGPTCSVGPAAVATPLESSTHLQWLAYRRSEFDCCRRHLRSSTYRLRTACYRSSIQ
jgi:hypothetical protein